MSSEETSPLLCGKCRIPVEGRTEADGSNRVRCPRCGENDTLNNAVREAAGHKAEKLVKGMFAGLGKSPYVTVTSSPEHSFRFITEDE